MTDYRIEFSKWWCQEFKSIKFPTQHDTIFDCYVDHETKKFELWSKKLSDLKNQTVVNIVEMLRLEYWINELVANKRSVLLIGGSGSGKSVLIEECLLKLNENWIVSRIPLNYYTNSFILQTLLEEKLEKKNGFKCGPVGQKKLIFYIDDLNTPQIDEYQTVQAHTILRQHLDHKHWYDRQKLNIKEIENCQYIASMNPNIGNSINPRLQRHFVTFALSMPTQVKNI